MRDRLGHHMEEKQGMGLMREEPEKERGKCWWNAPVNAIARYGLVKLRKNSEDGVEKEGGSGRLGSGKRSTQHLLKEHKN